MPDPDPKPAAEGLQFDRAEVAPALKCSACRTEIDDTYFKLAGKTICEECREKVEAPPDGSTPVRLLKAAAFGTAGAAIGAGIYYGVLVVSHLQIGLISILVGIIVGVAVNIGSERRGGPEFQLLAVALTYASITASFLLIDLNSPFASGIPFPDLVIRALSRPFDRGMQGILGLLIIGFGLYQAFVINKKKVLNIRGPFQRNPAAGSAAGG